MVNFDKQTTKLYKLWNGIVGPSTSAGLKKIIIKFQLVKYANLIKTCEHIDLFDFLC